MLSVNDVKLISIPSFGDDRGQLSIVEGNNNIPFDIKRIFYVYGAHSSSVRGQHANRLSSFFMISVSGSCKICVKDGVGGNVVYELNSPQMGLYVPRYLWKEMFEFSDNSVLLILADTYYDKSEYINVFAEYEIEYKQHIKC